MFNETLFHPERQVYRAATAGAYNFPSSYGIMASGSAFPNTGSIPVATGMTGTILSTGVNVRGSGTLFRSEFTIGDYIYAKNVVRRIVNIPSDTMIVLSQGFPTDITVAVIPLRCQSQYYKAIYAKNVHASTSAVVQEAPFAPGNTFFSGGAPIAYDASGGGTIEFQCHK